MANADRIIELLHEAKSRPAGAEREQFLAEACRDDAALKEQIVSLLEADADEGRSDFLKSSPVNRQAILLTEKPGDRIGRYKLLEQIGEGGCGVVYMAEQEAPVRRRVALKVIKLGMDTKQVIARFEAERQALAMMDHPNIAKVLDGGATETGRPFFVMELVRGIKITDYCDQNNLPTAERLELFMQVCQAIQHAHQKGIIHRDIKPSNILVTHHDDVAVPKVIDFGIAKATVGQLTDKTVFTAFAQFIGTPAYMSPEQAQMSGLDIDTRADIYSLGVLLYELLTGHTPFDAKELLAAGMDEMRRKIREDEPAKPSTCLSTMRVMDLTTVAKRRQAEPPKLIHLIRGDLDWLVMKCLEKDRTRRYETANGLAMDIQRHLDNEPITARPPSRLYEFQKTVRRHKFGFAAAAALIIVLGLGVLASTWQAVRATRAEREQIKLREEADLEKRTAQTEAAKSQQVAQFMQDMLQGVGPSAALGRDTTMLREILDKTAERIATDLKTQPEIEAEMRNSIGTVYWELGDYDKAAAMQRQALAIQRMLFGNEHPSVAASLLNLALALRNQQKLAESEATFRESLAMSRKLLGNEHPAVARVLNDLGSLLTGELKDDEPETLIREALAIRRKVYGNEHGDVGISLDNLAHILNRRGQVTEATAMHQEALAIRRKFFGESHPELLFSYKNIAVALQSQGKLAEAATVLQDALALSERLVGQQHPSFVALRLHLADVLQSQGKLKEAELLRSETGAPSRHMAASLHEAGRYQQWQGNLAGAEANYRAALAMKKTVFGAVHREVARTLGPLGQVLHLERKLAESELIYRELLAVEKKLTGEAHPVVASSLHQLAVVLQESGQSREAEARFRETVALREKLLGDQSGDVADSMVWIGITLSAQGRHAEAEGILREAQQILGKLPGWEGVHAHCLGRLAAELQHQGKTAELESLLQEFPGANTTAAESAQTWYGHGLWRLGDAYLQRHQFKEAEQAYDRALQKFKALQVQFPTNTFYRQEEAFSFRKLSDARQRAGRLPEAEASVRSAWHIYTQLAKEMPASTLYPQEATHTRRRLAELSSAQGRPAEAEAMWREELAWHRKVQGNVSSEVANSLHQLSILLRGQGKLTEAETMIRESLAIRRKLLGNEHIEVAWALNQLNYVLCDQAKLVEAEAAARESLAINQKLSGNTNPETAEALKNLAEVIRRQGNFSQAKTLFLEAAKHANAYTLNEIAFKLATAPSPKLRDGPVALTLAEKAVAGTNRKDPMIVDTLAAAYAEVGQFTNAVRVQLEAIALLQDENQKNDCLTRLKLYESGLPYRNHGQLSAMTKALLDELKPAEAEPLARECVALREKLIPDDWRTFNARSMLGGSLLGQKKYAEAEPWLISGYEGMKQREDKISAAVKARIQESLQRLVQLYEATGQSEKAAEWNKKLAEFEKAEAEKKTSTAKPQLEGGRTETK
ncbi:MAG: tetratricopeptide repeat protein [Verrucomicrobia bacterium]|nr:tetratricopeptide repeat protein [Verrucomicrobiota bacterium]